MSELPFYPGPTPQDETPITGHDSFIEVCKATIAKDAEHDEHPRWRFGNSLLTRRKDGTLVWRVDVTSNFGNRSRLVFWQPPGSDSEDVGFAYIPGRNLEELK
jgi:hypothetical protein